MRPVARPISAFLRPPDRFLRSVSIERDRHDPAALRGYVLTPWLAKAAGVLLDGLSEGSTRRAWRIAGDFGVGKSALALALVHALDPRYSDPDTPLAKLLKARSGASCRLFPLVISGSRRGLTAKLLSALKEVFACEFPKLEAPGARADPLEALLDLRSALVARGDYDGLLLVVDEMGKFLEAASVDPGKADIFALQGIAEAASRSGSTPLFVVTILHHGIQAYGEGSPNAARSEWAKVAERFEEIVFDHPLSHTAALMDAAIGLRGKLPACALSMHDAASRAARRSGWALPFLEEGQCFPIHPMAVPPISRFFTIFGQNERSLFGFLASEEANGLRAFAASTLADGQLYRLDQFFDYISTSFTHRLLARGSASDWERIRTVLEGLGQADELERAVLKIVGVLNLVDGPDLPATEEALIASLAPAFAPSDVASAVKRLRASGVLFERTARAGLRLWTSRRVDLVGLWQEAEQEMTAEAARARLVETLISLPIRPYLLARRHSIESGTTRRFVVRIIPISSLRKEPMLGDADGEIVLLLPRDKAEEAAGMAWSREATQGNRTLISVVMQPAADLTPIILELLRYRRVAAAPSLYEDAHAATEIRRRVSRLEALLVNRVEAACGLGGRCPEADVAVFRSGKAISAPPPLHVLASDLFDTVFDRAPLVDNEMINKHALTSAAAAARQRLIEAMFANANQPELGFDSNRNPPERSLYRSLLLRGRVHREDGDGWALDFPEEQNDPLRLRPALERLREKLTATPARVAVTNLYSELGRDPYGVRGGLAPLMLAIILASNQHRLAVFERGTFCPRFDGPAFMRILKAPQQFELQWVAIEGVRAEVFRRVRDILGAGARDGLLSVVEPLVRFGTGLNHYAQRTLLLSPLALAVRTALLKASSPLDLLFVDLPTACGFPPFGVSDKPSKMAASDFATKLEEAIGELRASYPELLRRMTNEICAGLEESGGRAGLRARAQALLFRVKEQQLRTFVQRAADAALDDDAWIEALGGALVGKPPSRWLAADEASWGARLDEMCSAFLRTEAASFRDGAHGHAAVRLALTHGDGHESISVVRLDRETTAGDRLLARTILTMMSEHDSSAERILALLAMELIKGRSEDAGEAGRVEGA